MVSDWSSDVCSSDLLCSKLGQQRLGREPAHAPGVAGQASSTRLKRRSSIRAIRGFWTVMPARPTSVSLESERQKKVASDLFNYVWTLLEKPDRTRRETDRIDRRATC